MIKTFADKDTRQFFEGQRVRSFEAIADPARRRLDALAVAETLRELQARPGNRFEALKGDRAGQYSVRINAQWRVCFRWQPKVSEPPEEQTKSDPLDVPGDAVDVMIVDYH
jgi:proteic killer suppression protein